ncbi:MAG TPA: ketopantoate reductase family protein [Reyranella sp.]|jgi:2-dehydropantoate 2-reductase|nr:ketopantoate reductase family protein [Reyranella sp.]
MRILVVGAGAIGGFFGGRLLAAGRGVTFLVRERRAAQLAKTGLVIRSKLGDVHVPSPPLVSAETLKGPYDVVLLACKAFDLDGALAAFAPAVGPDTAILPLLNGLAHLDALADRFSKRNVLGGQAGLPLTLDAEGRILHLAEMLAISFGELDGTKSPRVAALAAEFAAAGIEAGQSSEILQEMWDKWAFIATAGGITCLMRGTVGDIVAGGGAPLAMALYDEIGLIAAANGHPLQSDKAERGKAMLTAAGSPFNSSMARDVENGFRTEAEHVVGDLLRRAKGGQYPVLMTALTHLRTYEARRKREGKADR